MGWNKDMKDYLAKNKTPSVKKRGSRTITPIFIDLSTIDNYVAPSQPSPTLNTPVQPKACLQARHTSPFLYLKNFQMASY